MLNELVEELVEELDRESDGKDDDVVVVLLLLLLLKLWLEVSESDWLSSLRSGVGPAGLRGNVVTPKILASLCSGE